MTFAGKIVQAILDDLSDRGGIGDELAAIEDDESVRTEMHASLAAIVEQQLLDGLRGHFVQLTGDEYRVIRRWLQEHRDRLQRVSENMQAIHAGIEPGILDFFYCSRFDMTWDQWRQTPVDARQRRSQAWLEEYRRLVLPFLMKFEL